MEIKNITYIKKNAFRLLVILWACVIFFMSSMNANESNDKSKGTINEIVEKTVEVTNELGITNIDQTKTNIEQITNKLNPPLRKVAHASEYCVFTILIIIVLKNSKLKNKKIYLIAISICFIYACTDEYHQTFVNGRTGQFIDTLIDTLGGIIGCTLHYIINKKITHKHKTQ